MVYGASALSCDLISQFSLVHGMQTYCGGNDSLVDVNLVHGLLATGNQNFMHTFRGERHAAQILHVILTATVSDLA